MADLEIGRIRTFINQAEAAWFTVYDSSFGRKVIVVREFRIFNCRSDLAPKRRLSHFSENIGVFHLVAFNSVISSPSFIAGGVTSFKQTQVLSLITSFPYASFPRHLRESV